MENQFNNQKEIYLIGEIGINHNGDLQIAKKLIDAVNACGWNCAKFQKRTPDICVPDKQKNIMRDTPWGKMTYINYKHKIEFEKEEYDYIDQYCKQKPIDWTASVWDIPSLEFILTYNVPFIKIPSAMITDLTLLKELSMSNQKVIISTGMSTLEEIDTAVNILLKGNNKPIIMHTNSSYPTPPEEINLNLIPFLKKRYDCIIGYSGHEQNLTPTIIAASLGASVIERHITLSHNMWGTDQKASLEVMAMDMLKKRLNDVNIILGSAEKTITSSELPIREKLRK